MNDQMTKVICILLLLVDALTPSLLYVFYMRLRSQVYLNLPPPTYNRKDEYNPARLKPIHRHCIFWHRTPRSLHLRHPRWFNPNSTYPSQPPQDHKFQQHILRTYRAKPHHRARYHTPQPHLHSRITKFAMNSRDSPPMTISLANLNFTN